jgi:hypothetical protein
VGLEARDPIVFTVMASEVIAKVIRQCHGEQEIFAPNRTEPDQTNGPSLCGILQDAVNARLADPGALGNLGGTMSVGVLLRT